MGYLADEQQLIDEYNLPSRRWKIRRIRTGYDKKLRRLDKELDKIDRQIRNLGYEDLVPPIQRGYVRMFVLTKETEEESRADFYREILKQINTVQYSSTKDFKERKRRIAKWKYQKFGDMRIRNLTESWFEYTKELTDEQKSYFYPAIFYRKTKKREEFEKMYVFTEPWRFEVKVKPYMITQKQIKDHALEQKSAELSDLLSTDRNVRRLAKMRGQFDGWRRYQQEYVPKPKYKHMLNSLKNKQLHLIEDQYREEISLWEYEQKN